MVYYAHTISDADGDPLPTGDWEPLYTGPCATDCADCSNLSPQHGHLNKVAFWTARFAADMFAPNSDASRVASALGRCTGLWHDLGKFSAEFQQLLRNERHRADHSTAGAQFAAEKCAPLGQLLAYLIAGHHAGLADWNCNGSDSDLSRRLNTHTIPDYRSYAPRELLEPSTLPNPPCRPVPTEVAFFTRFLFSCLVDADFLATEAFVNRVQYDRRLVWPEDILPCMRAALDTRFAEFGHPATPVDRQRAAVRDACIKAAAKEPGLFTLTVPTGGGKTLSSLAFAIEHAIRHKLRRIIYVIPYTSIIEQNADEFRRAFHDLAARLGQDLVLEHHANFESDNDECEADEKPIWRLTAENWNAPLVITTNVQLFESLYANRTGRCRKLHNIARSVLILDEVQNLPVDLLSPCLDALRHLTQVFGCTAVLCTATQPAVGRRDEEFPIGLDLRPDREITPHPLTLYRSLRRVTIHQEAEDLPDTQLVARLREHSRVLCIVNTRRHAERLFGLLDPDDGANLHLSAQMCPAHRAVVLAEIRERERQGAPCRLIATTVVEAGVDIDFPVVFRAMTGLDSFAQAAGRCNRHGRLATDTARVTLFTPADETTPGFLQQQVNAARNVLPDHRDLLGLDAIEAYFCQYYFLRGRSSNWDRKDILGRFRVQNSTPAFLFDFKTAAKDFQLIPDTLRPVIIEPKPNLWAGMDEATAGPVRRLIAEIRSTQSGKFPPPKGAHTSLQRYTVQIPASIWEAAHRNQGLIEVFHDRFPILVHPENNYDSQLGLRLNAALPTAFMI